MDITTVVKNNFSYLIKNKYKFCKKERNSEIEIEFAKNSLIIEIYIDSYNENIDIVISKNGQRKNVLDCGFISKEVFCDSTKNMGLGCKLELLSGLIRKHFVEIEN